MSIAANILVILLVALIGYWWGNQGLFSALLHLLCVIVAGAIALAFWEPLAGVLIRDTWFDRYAWGTSLLVLFTVSLLVLRIGMDKLAPANVRMPRWVNLVFGCAAGVGAGVLTMGIVVIGIGHIQATNTLMGIQSWGRQERDGRIAHLPMNQRLWVPVEQMTADFYSWLSVTSLGTGRPLRRYSPDLARETYLIRDSFGGGRGEIALRAKDAQISHLYYRQDKGHDVYLIEVHFAQGALDYGERLTLSASQIALIGAATGFAEAPVAYPVAWYQPWSGYHEFNNYSHFISSEPGKESANPIIEFEVPSGFVPQFIKIRGTRFSLPKAMPAPPTLIPPPAVAQAAGNGEPAQPAGGPIDDLITVSNDIRPLSISTNRLPGTIEERDKYLTKGTATFKGTGERGSPKLRIEGILEPEGVRCVKVDVSRDTGADIFALVGEVGEDAKVSLLDDEGGTYTAIGYMYEPPGETTIALDPARRFLTLHDLPFLPTAGRHRLRLIFWVTEGRTVTGLSVGNRTVGFANVYVNPKTSKR